LLLLQLLLLQLLQLPVSQLGLSQSDPLHVLQFEPPQLEPLLPPVGLLVGAFPV
jgi:hypothetical protein